MTRRRTHVEGGAGQWRSRALTGRRGAAVAAVAGTGALVAGLLLVPSAGPGAGGPARAAGSGGTAHASGVSASKDCTNDELYKSVPPSTAEGPTIKDIKTRTDKPNRLIVGVDQNSYRWGFRNPQTNDLEGFDIDLVRRIAKEVLGDEKAVAFKTIPTNQRIAAIQNGDVDMVVRTMTITCERLADVAFSTVYFETGQQLLVPQGSPITGYDDSLKGRRLCSAENSTALGELKKKSFGADIRTQVPNQLDCLVRLQLGQVDGVVTDSALAAGQAAQDPAVHLVGSPFTKEYYGIAMKKDATDLVARVNRVLEDYRKSGWSASYDKWLAADLGGGAKPPGPEVSP
ncbi:glutamate ABC transporter substrate-binding protein [Streptomyces sp. NPDC049954]|uniref:glutamate ABC transporter substrate-binding protein n=1 Tax=Streptomyces sp. NPDC049954 TaxID=3155779 RepID=UPI0034280E7C